MNVAGRQLALDQRPYVIAELGVNHDGRVDRAIEMVEAARAAGADAIKLQLFEARRLVSAAAPLAAYQESCGAADARELLEGLELEVGAAEAVAGRARALGLHAIVTVFNLELVERIDRSCWDAFKVASPDLVNRPLIEALMSMDRPLILSTGAATLGEVAAAVSWLDGHPHAIMQCVSAYPTPDESASLAALHALRAVDPGAIGYSDHTVSVDTGGLAVAAGARLLEKHLTHDRAAPGPDHAASLEPAQFAEYVRLAHRAFRMLGPPRKGVLPIEEDVRRAARQSIVAVRPLAGGARLRREDLTLKRAGRGAGPHRLAALLGRTLRRDIAADCPIEEDDVA